jgi:hypothetical protein
VPPYDHARRRKAQKHQKGDRGVWVYISAEELAAAGRTAPEGTLTYRVWGTPRGGVFVRLYKEA